MDIILSTYTMISFAFFLDIQISVKTLRQIKAAVPMKQRGDVINSIEYLEDLKKYCVIWPYAIYKLLQDNER